MKKHKIGKLYTIISTLETRNGKKYIIRRVTFKTVSFSEKYKNEKGYVKRNTSKSIKKGSWNEILGLNIGVWRTHRL